MKKSIVFMFSGQGSQYYFMGKELYETHPRFRLWMNHCNKIVSPLIKESLINILYQQNNKTDSFDRVLHSNPALICIEYSLTKVLMEMGIQPDYLLGYSFGEITAAVVSGAVSLEDAIEFSVDYALLLEKQPSPAAMLAIIESEDIMHLFPEIFTNCSLTGKNFQKNFVVCGAPENIEHLKGALTEKGIVSQKLSVNHGFHTKLMDPLETQFKQLSQKMIFNPIKTPIFSSSTTGQIAEVTNEHIWGVIRNPVNFSDTVNTMLQKNEDYIFVDVGPSGTLSTFVKYLRPNDSKSLHLETINQFGKDILSLDKLKSTFRREGYSFQ